MFDYSQVLSKIIDEQRRRFDDNYDRAVCLIGLCQELKTFCPKKNRQELIELFVGFCEGRMSQKVFKKKAEDLISRHCLSAANHPAARIPASNSRYFWMPSPRP